MPSAHLISLQVGPPHAMDDDGQPVRGGGGTWTSSIAKSAVYGRRTISRLGLAEDAQADTVHHGGPDKAINCYAWEHYDHWRSALERPDLEPGAFGENFTLLGLTESEACIGDVYRVGTALVQVSQPRIPCWKLARRWQREDLPEMVIATGFTGWYVRVLEEGVTGSATTFELMERPYPLVPVRRANDVMHFRPDDRESAAELAACDALAEVWRGAFRERAGITARRP